MDKHKTIQVLRYLLAKKLLKCEEHQIHVGHRRSDVPASYEWDTTTNSEKPIFKVSIRMWCPVRYGVVGSQIRSIGERLQMEINDSADMFPASMQPHLPTLCDMSIYKSNRKLCLGNKGDIYPYPSPDKKVTKAFKRAGVQYNIGDPEPVKRYDARELLTYTKPGPAYQYLIQVVDKSIASELPAAPFPIKSNSPGAGESQGEKRKATVLDIEDSEVIYAEILRIFHHLKVDGGIPRIEQCDSNIRGVDNYRLPDVPCPYIGRTHNSSPWQGIMVSLQDDKATLSCSKCTHEDPEKKDTRLRQLNSTPALLKKIFAQELDWKKIRLIDQSNTKGEKYEIVGPCLYAELAGNDSNHATFFHVTKKNLALRCTKCKDENGTGLQILKPIRQNKNGKRAKRELAGGVEGTPEIEPGEAFSFEKAVKLWDAKAGMAGPMSTTHNPILTEYLDNYYCEISPGDGCGLIGTRARTTDPWILNDPKSASLAHKKFEMRKTVEWMSKDEDGQDEIHTVLAEKNMFSIWQKQFDHLTFKKVVFDPTHVGDNISKGELNLFRGFAAKEIEGDVDMSKIERILFHLEKVVCASRKADADWLIKWLAHMVQFPGQKPGTSIFSIGEQGTGKTSFPTFFGKSIIGDRHYRSVGDLMRLTGKFNGAMEAKLLCIANEVSWGGDHKASEILKSLVADGDQELEKKFKDVITIADLCRYWFTSNGLHVIKVMNAEKDRRDFVTRVADIFRDKPKSEAKAYFDTLHKDFDDPEVADHFFTYLKRIDISPETGFNPRFAPVTDERREQELLSMDGMDQFLYDFMENQRSNDQIETVISISDLYEKCMRFHNTYKGAKDFTPNKQALGTRLQHKRTIFECVKLHGRKKDPVRYLMKIAPRHLTEDETPPQAIHR